ncbi:MAG: hypothetical protein QM760_09540 [Nibricoccus sp.]
MNKMLRTITVLSLFTLCSALFASTRTWDIGSRSDSTSIFIEMYYAGDYTFELINNSTSQTVAVLSTTCSFNYSVPDYYYDDYYYGSSGTPYINNSWGTWDLEDLPSGDYSVRVTDYTHPYWVYELSNVF